MVTVQPQSTTGTFVVPAPLPTSLIPVTGGQLVNLVCGTRSTVRTPDGKTAEFLANLCGYQVSFMEEQANTLPSPVTGTFTSGITLQILFNGSPLKLVPENASVRISFPMPDGSITADFMMLFWNVDLNNGAGGWQELPQTPGKLNPSDPQDTRQILSGLQIVNGYAQITVNFTGTFVIVHN